MRADPTRAVVAMLHSMLLYRLVAID